MDDAWIERPVDCFVDEQELLVVQRGFHATAFDFEVFYNRLNNEKNDRGKNQGFDNVSNRGLHGAPTSLSLPFSESRIHWFHGSHATIVYSRWRGEVA